MLTTALLTWIAIGAAGLVLLFLFVVYRKGRPLAGPHVFRASRLSRGNRLLPSQVIITPTGITHYHPQWIGKLEKSIHMAHVASVKIDTNLIFSDVFIETTGGQNPIACHGHTKRDAIRIKDIVGRYQSEYYQKRESDK